MRKCIWIELNSKLICDNLLVNGMCSRDTEECPRKDIQEAWNKVCDEVEEEVEWL